ncbi:MAG: hypothetical protein IPO91_03310 [Chloroflexi bacterium]|nr:hypothetical protein [Chloroflexota bacterium]
MNSNNLKRLNLDQLEQADQRAKERIQRLNGDRPTRTQFRRETGAAWTVLDLLALIVFFAALAVSSAHIVTHMGHIATQSFNGAIPAGIVLSLNDFTVIHQIGMILLAEASMLLFMVMHGLNSSARVNRSRWLKPVSLPLVLALVAAVFVFVANWQSGIGLLESIMPPVFTVGIGVHLEKLIVTGIQRRQEIDDRYLTALTVYEQAATDPTKHPEYIPLLRQEIWEKLVSLPSNRDFRNAPPSFKHAAVRFELERSRWAYGDPTVEIEEWEPERPTTALSIGRKHSSGSTRPVPDDDGFITPTLHANGHGTDVIILNGNGNASP